MPPEDDLRSAIESAIDGADGGEGSAQTTLDPGIPEADPGPSGAAAPEGEGSGKPAPTRDAMGRFLPKTAQEAPGDAQTPSGTQPLAAPLNGQPAPAQAAAAPVPAVPAPAGWTATAREAWAQAPVAVQQEVARREQQMQQFVNDTAPARQLGERFYQAVQPFMATIQAEGVDPLTAVTNLMQTVTRLRMGTPLERAQTGAQILRTYGIDLQILDSLLAGQAPPASAQGVDPSFVQNAVQQALAPLYQAAQQRQYGIQQAAETHARSEMESFATDGKHPHFDTLRGMMADMIEVAQRQGSDMSLEDAYDRAALLHPEISRVIIAQRQGAMAQNLTTAAQRAKAAAVSVRGTAPVGNPNPSEPSSIRESIEAAIEAHSRY